MRKNWNPILHSLVYLTRSIQRKKTKLVWIIIFDSVAEMNCTTLLLLIYLAPCVSNDLGESVISLCSLALEFGISLCSLAISLHASLTTGRIAVRFFFDRRNCHETISVLEGGLAIEKRSGDDYQSVFMTPSIPLKGRCDIERQDDLFLHKLDFTNNLWHLMWCRSYVEFLIERQAEWQCFIGFGVSAVTYTLRPSCQIFNAVDFRR